MQFNSLPFAVFLPMFFLLYWTLGAGGKGRQNLLLLLANIVFYAAWDWRFLLLLLGAAGVDFLAGLRLGGSGGRLSRRLWFGISLSSNIGLLLAFKYFDFFATSAAGLLTAFGFAAHWSTLRLVLPLGISFFSFMRLNYTIDVFRKNTAPCRDLLEFLCFATFFPCVTAGPIERARRLLPQMSRPRTFQTALARDGLRQILWGLFRKIVIADFLVGSVDRVFGSPGSFSGLDLALGAVVFGVQVYCDFSAYSDISMGVGKLLGFRIMRNFSYPYFARDISEFWQRWHISMSSWFRDYVHTPLSMRVSLDRRWRRTGNILLTFAASGLWHGANWTYVFWGLLHGLYFLPLIFGTAPQRDPAIVARGRWFPSLGDARRMLVTFTLVQFSWIFFRADSIGLAWDYIGRMVSGPWLQAPQLGLPVFMGMAMIIVEWLRREHVHALEIDRFPLVVRWAVYLGLVFSILLFGSFGVQGFFYAQF